MSSRCGNLLFAALWLATVPTACGPVSQPSEGSAPEGVPYVVVLGTVQDAGSPQAGCRKACCAALWDAPDPERRVVSLGLVDPAARKVWLLEASPDLPEQLEFLRKDTPFDTDGLPEGIFLTHAHIGHYTGLMYLGREVMGARGVPVYAMPRMREFLSRHGPWKQLVDLDNISLRPLSPDSTLRLSNQVRITPLPVPHRDEYSETVGFRIEGPRKSLLFIPDIDKWERWERSIVEEVKAVDYAFLDATFHSEDELSGRNMAEIPHPFVPETINLFEKESAAEKAKIHFIHLNHTNPLLISGSRERKAVEKAGYRVAVYGMRVHL